MRPWNVSGRNQGRDACDGKCCAPDGIGSCRRSLFLAGNRAADHMRDPLLDACIGSKKLLIVMRAALRIAQYAAGMI